MCLSLEKQRALVLWFDAASCVSPTISAERKKISAHRDTPFAPHSRTQPLPRCCLLTVPFALFAGLLQSVEGESLRHANAGGEEKQERRQLFPSLSVAYSLSFSVSEFRLPLPSELEELSELTQGYMEDFFMSVSEVVVSADTSMEAIAEEGDIFDVEFETTLTLTSGSDPETMPRTSAEGAFEDESYLQALRKLPKGNLFSTATALTYSAEEESTL